jgi:hypothetical protein
MEVWRTQNSIILGSYGDPFIANKMGRYGGFNIVAVMVVHVVLYIDIKLGKYRGLQIAIKLGRYMTLKSHYSVEGWRTLT